MRLDRVLAKELMSLELLLNMLMVESLGSQAKQVWLRVSVLTFTRKVWVNHSLPRAGEQYCLPQRMLYTFHLNAYCLVSLCSPF